MSYAGTLTQSWGLLSGTGTLNIDGTYRTHTGGADIAHLNIRQGGRLECDSFGCITDFRVTGGTVTNRAGAGGGTVLFVTRNGRVSVESGSVTGGIEIREGTAVISGGTVTGIMTIVPHQDNVTGVVTQTGGTVTTARGLQLGDNSYFYVVNRRGVYELGGTGVLDVSDTSTGEAGLQVQNGTFRQTGGTLTGTARVQLRPGHTDWGTGDPNGTRIGPGTATPSAPMATASTATWTCPDWPP